MSTKIGFIGQGWIGKHYADDFENRGYDTVRYGLEEPYVANKDQIKECDVVFVAVPTPTTPEGFDDSIVRGVLGLLRDGATAVIKSTITPGTTESLQEQYPHIIVLHSPEFLREASAAHDAAHPDRNLIGVAKDTPEHKAAAEFVLRVLPYAPYNQIMSAKDAELTKYLGNCFLYSKVVFMNILHDFVKAQGADWEAVRAAMIEDPRIGSSHTQPVHRSNDERPDGRGAGGHCFIKDFEAFRELLTTAADPEADAIVEKMIAYNNRLLVESEKDLDILTGVYGQDYVDKLQDSAKK
jgi:UDPglucose 6-dehydrogenase